MIAEIQSDFDAWVKIGGLLLGTIGTTLGIVNFCWNVHTHRLNRIQRADATVRIIEKTATQDAHLIVKVQNTGAIAMYIDRVQIQWAKPVDIHGTCVDLAADISSFHTASGPFLAPRSGLASHDTENLPPSSATATSPNRPIPPFDACEFHWLAADKDLLKKIIEMGNDGVWLSVQAHNRELCRLRGKAFWPHFISIARCWGA